MNSFSHYAAPVLAVGAIGAALFASPIAAAAPQCANVGPNTTQCQTNGSSQIVTSPSVQTGPYWGGWPWGGGLVINLGGWGK
ncbi:hypothetical protein H7J88_13885 [Mycolicibacterium flavescens]|uniref:Uncharacterized protein n=1 Tax=Mycolicibacterium flavescens TaxID=1776 RepID=A0A1E3RE05_MYCFV|nr:hypothetical protein [Mycolicibacterium flavescens]MCV7280735.1 hypothetical protein [Mycolicibacterium flavescens]ODQ88083.1 hypothetical protein BHQ18_21130 [Mycolicibacterium flavescens]